MVSAPVSVQLHRFLYNPNEIVAAKRTPELEWLRSEMTTSQRTTEFGRDVRCAVEILERLVTMAQQCSTKQARDASDSPILVCEIGLQILLRQRKDVAEEYAWLMF